MGIKPLRIGPDKLFAWILDFLLEKEVGESEGSQSNKTKQNILNDRPVEGIQRENTKLSFVRAVGTQLQKEVGELWNMLAKNGDFL
jgi:hypothetical protein